MMRFALLLVSAALALTFPLTADAWIAKSVDTMKESLDRSDQPLTQTQINQHVSQIAALGATHVTVDTPMDRPTVYGQWVTAARKYKLKVWHRPTEGGYPSAPWTSNPAFTPSDYLARFRQFILDNPTFFKSGDLLDGDDEADAMAYWDRYADSDWWNGSNPPYTATYTQACNEFNQYLLDLKYTADAALATKHVSGVDARPRSLNPWWATANCLKDSTIQSLGSYLTLDAYWDRTTPSDEASAINADLEAWHAYRPYAHIVIGEYGWSNDCGLGSDDLAQKATLHAALPVFNKTYVDGFNYWVGAGGPGMGGCTNILTGSSGAWSPRPAASELAAFYAP